jgi:hypothetical protein
MDDLLALMGNAEETDNDIFEVNTNEASLSFAEEEPVKELSESREKGNSKGSVGVVDPLTKIRIINRKRSKVEMVDIISPMTFHSTASLASMSKAILSTLIVKPSANDDAAGKSNMATMGIVFSNSGTRISKNGRGFCALTLGELHTGPTVSVLLFGDAYSTHTKQVKAGDVISVLASNILPSQNGRETRISLSVSESDQIVHVGKAMDYGLCSMVEKKKVQFSNAFHSGVMEQDVRCKNYVDLRCATYCKFHMKKAKDQQQRQSGSAIHGGKKTQTFMQNAREEHKMKQPFSAFQNSNSTLTILQPNRQNIVASTNSVSMNTQKPKISSSGGMAVSMALQDALHSRNDGLTTKLSSTIVSNNLLSNASIASKLKKAPRHIQVNHGTLNVNRSIENKNNDHNDLLGEALNPDTTSNKTNPYTRKRQILQGVNKFDGQVQVPRPCSLFGDNILRQTPALNTKRGESSIQNITNISPEQTLQIREQQKRLADQLKKQPIPSKVINPYTNKTEITSSDTFFNQVTLSDETKSSILSAKSKFSSEAESALYAQSRQTMNELEKQESALEKRELKKKKSNQENDDTLIKSVYICGTCRKTTKFKPQTCIRQRHQVKIRRELKKKEDLAESRQKKNKDATKEGGLVLGAGLEWSGWTHRDD